MPCEEEGTALGCSQEADAYPDARQVVDRIVDKACIRSAVEAYLDSREMGFASCEVVGNIEDGIAVVSFSVSSPSRWTPLL